MGLEQMKLDSKLASAVADALKKMASECSAEDIDTTLKYCLELGITPPAHISYGDVVNVRAIYNRSKECAVCKGKSTACQKYTARIENGHIKVARENCTRANYEQILKFANLPEKYRGLNASYFQKKAGNRAAASAASACVTDNKGLYLYGECGLGKTLLCCLIANERAFRGKKSYFVTVTDMMTDLTNFADSLVRQNKLRIIKNVSCLIIDDLGAEYQSELIASLLFEVLDYRYKNNRQTIINSNLPLSELATRIKGYHGERIQRRIASMCEQIQITE